GTPRPAAGDGADPAARSGRHGGRLGPGLRGPGGSGRRAPRLAEAPAAGGAGAEALQRGGRIVRPRARRNPDRHGLAPSPRPRSPRRRQPRGGGGGTGFLLGERTAGPSLVPGPLGGAAARRPGTHGGPPPRPALAA